MFLVSAARRAPWSAALWALVGVGMLLRIVRYAADRSLWGDEGALALNILQRSPRDLLRPLDYLQGAPTGFLLAEKLATDVLGDAELQLRLFPLLCGLGAMVLLALVARRLLGPEAAVLAIALAAFSEPLVYYSSEVKQYETDVFAALVLLYAAVAVDWAGVRLLSGLGLALGGAAVVWFSHAALLVLPSLLVVLVVSAWSRRDRPAVRALVLLGIVWGTSAIGAYWLNRQNTHVVASLALNTTGSSGQGLSEPLRKLWDAYDDVVGVAKSATALAVVLAVAGFVVLWRRNRTHAALLVAPGVAAFLAGMANRYPFSDRFILFLAPSLILLAAAGGVALIKALPSSLTVAGAAAVGLLVLYPASVSVDHAVRPPGHEEVKTVLRAMERGWRPGDDLFVWYQSQYPFRYYAMCGDCGVLGAHGPASVVWPSDPRAAPAPDALETHPPRLVLSRSSHDLSTYAEGLRKLDGRRRVWLLFSSTWDDDFVRHLLDCMGRRVDEFRATRAVAYLYDLAAPPATPRCAG